MVPQPLAVRAEDGEDGNSQYQRKSPEEENEADDPPTPTMNYFVPPIQTGDDHSYTYKPHGFGPIATSPGIPNYSPTSQTEGMALPDNTGVASSVPSSSSSNKAPDTSATDTGGYINYPPYDDHSKHGPPIIAMIVVPIALLAIIGAIVFFCLRKRRKSRQVLPRGQDQEMRERSPSTQPYIAPTPLPSAAPLPQPLSPVNLSPTTSTVPEPVILGPITGSNNNYFTGIDTSDVMSVQSNERTGLGNPFADDHGLDDEPPPPYYPSSVPSLSRGSSMRIDAPPRSVSSQTELISARPTPVRSPFEDPGDDAVSEISIHGARRDGDTLSTVLDLSYQHDPIVRRPRS